MPIFMKVLFVCSTFRRLLIRTRYRVLTPSPNGMKFGEMIALDEKSIFQVESPHLDSV